MDAFEQCRPLLFSIAYRMLGSAREAEDMVQEAYLRGQAADKVIHSPKAYFSTIVTRLCLDYLKSAQSRRETYIGPWLPEPFITADTTLPEPMKRVEDLDSISMAFLVLLEHLTPAERAVFLLREVFDYDYSEIATMLDKDEAACRQLFSRARKHIHDNRPRYKSSTEEHAALFFQFIQACQAGDLDGLTQLLAEDAVAYSDGGGKVQAATRPVYGRERVAKLMVGISKHTPQRAAYEVQIVNSEPGLIIRIDDHINAVMLIETGDSYIRNIRIIRNPDKFSHL
ncbi:MAG: RNA polymerase sigma-70 factor [Anaerolineae bacterium]